jgi:hypothetical protein
MLLNTCLLHDKYVIVSADKAPNNIVFVHVNYLERGFVEHLADPAT